MRLVHFCLVLGLLAAFGRALAEDAPKAAEEDISKLELFTEEQAGYSVRLPGGYQLMSDDENRAIMEGLSAVFGKEFAERTAQMPPKYFKGPIDPARPKAMRPTLAIQISGLDEPVEAAKITEYKDRLEANYKKHGLQYGDMKLEVLKIDGVNALRVEHEIYSPVDNSRSYKLYLSVPGSGRRYEILFDCSPNQVEGVQAAAATVIRSFKRLDAPLLDPQTQSKWTRIALWTVGGFVAGVALSLLLKFLTTRGSARTPEQTA
jgi:hypothetical protein